MRNAFIEPEKSLIQKIEEAIHKIDTSRLTAKVVVTLNAELKKILEEGKAKILLIQQKYQHLKSVKTVPELTEIWQKLTEVQNTFLAEVDAFETGMQAIAARVIPMRTREETLNELIANVSADRDHGRSQATVLQQIQADVISNAAMAMLGLSDEARADSDTCRQCVEAALQSEVNRLREMNDPAVMAMWDNQQAAAISFITEFSTTWNKTQLIQPLGDEVIAAWEAFNRYSKKYFESKKEDHRLQALTKVVAEIKQALSSAQRRVKAPVTDYGLQYLMEEMTSGQEAYFALFCEGQKRYRNAINIIYQFAEEEMASESDEDSQASSSTSSSSFFSESGRKRARSLASTETSSSDALSSDSSEETEEEESEMSLAR